MQEDPLQDLVFLCMPHIPQVSLQAASTHVFHTAQLHGPMVVVANVVVVIDEGEVEVIGTHTNLPFLAIRI